MLKSASSLPSYEVRVDLDSLPQQPVNLPEFEKYCDRLDLASNADVIRRLFDAITYEPAPEPTMPEPESTQSKEIEPEIIREFYECWKDNEARSREMHAVLSSSVDGAKIRSPPHMDPVIKVSELKRTVKWQARQGSRVAGQGHVPRQKWLLFTTRRVGFSTIKQISFPGLSRNPHYFFCGDPKLHRLIPNLSSHSAHASSYTCTFWFSLRSYHRKQSCLLQVSALIRCDLGMGHLILTQKYLLLLKDGMAGGSQRERISELAKLGHILCE